MSAEPVGFAMDRFHAALVPGTRQHITWKMRDSGFDRTEGPRALAKAIPAAKFEIIADSGHDLTLEQPIVTASRVAKFSLSPMPD